MVQQNGVRGGGALDNAVWAALDGPHAPLAEPGTSAAGSAL
ncbi:hypothetical protein ACIPSA_18220 [Streptomyces sp. NPDC086549]